MPGFQAGGSFKVPADDNCRRPSRKMNACSEEKTWSEYITRELYCKRSVRNVDAEEKETEDSAFESLSCIGPSPRRQYEGFDVVVLMGAAWPRRGLNVQIL